MYKYNIAKHFDGKKKDIEETHSKKWQIDVIRFNNRQASLLVIKKKRSFKFHEMLLYRMGWVMKSISSYKRISMYLNFACFFLLKVWNKALWCFSTIFCICLNKLIKNAINIPVCSTMNYNWCLFLWRVNIESRFLWTLTFDNQSLEKTHTQYLSDVFSSKLPYDGK